MRKKKKSIKKIEKTRKILNFVRTHKLVTRTRAHILRRFLQAKSVPWVNFILSAYWPSRNFLTIDLKRHAQLERTLSH